MSFKKRICVVIVNYKTSSLALDCINSLTDQLNTKRDCIVVVDNNSGGEDLVILKNAIDQMGLEELVTLIPSSVNGGFSAGNNIGIKSVIAEYYLLTNTDTVFRSGSISSLLSAATEYPDAGIISPRLEWLDGKAQVSCFRFHSPFSEIINSAGTGLITKILSKFDVPLQVDEKVTFPQWTSFACVLIKNEVFEKVGFLDDGYFMYYEDVDYCRRVRKAGYNIVNWPTAHVVHLHGQSSGVNKMEIEKKRLPAYYYNSRARYFKKFYGFSGLIISNIFWYMGRIVSFLREILLGKNKTVSQFQSIDIWKK